MVIRIRLQGAKAVDLSQQLALAVGSLLAPLALLAFTVAFWAFAAEAQWTSTFLFQGTALSHWQVWISVAALLMVFGHLLEKLGAARTDADVAERTGSFPECQSRPLDCPDRENKN